VVTLRHNKVESFPTHVESFRRLAGSRNSYEWIVIDNGSNDGVEDWIEDHRKDFDHVLHLPVNIGPDHGMNRGLIERKPGQIVLAVATDEPILAPDNFIDNTKRYIKKFPAITYGAIPCCTPIIIMAPEFGEVFGYFNEATLGYELDFVKRSLVLGKHTRELPIIVYRQPKQPNAAYQKAIRKILRRWVEMAQQYGECFNNEEVVYRSSLGDAKSLEIYNPIVKGKSYEDISLENLRFFQEAVDDDLGIDYFWQYMRIMQLEDMVDTIRDHVFFSNFGYSILNAPGNK
jgi:glycosyltransferase involved in cell wall biosynthesis